jgi:hypothetical protein
MGRRAVTFAVLLVATWACLRSGDAEEVPIDAPIIERAVEVPLSASVITRPLEINNQTLIVTLAKTPTEYFLFPVLVVAGASVEFGDGTRGELIGPDGRLALRYADGRGDPPSFVAKFAVQNALMNSALEKAITAAIEGAGGMAENLQRQEPRLLEPATAAFSLRTAVAPSGYLTLHTSAESGRWKPQEIRFAGDATTAREAAWLCRHPAGAKLSNTLLTVSVPCVMKVKEDEWRITGEVMTQAIAKVSRRLRSEAGGQSAVLFVNLGGSVDLVARVLRQAAQDFVATVEVPAGKPRPDPELVSRIIEGYMGMAKADWARVNQDDTVALLMRDGVRLSMAFGQVSGVAERLSSLSEESLHDLLERASKEDKNVKVDVGAGAVTKVVSVRLDVGVDYSRLTEEQQKAVRDSFRRNAQDVARTFSGQLPTVTALRLSEEDESANQGRLAQVVQSVSTSVVTRDVELPCYLEDERIRGLVSVPPSFRKALWDYVGYTSARWPQERVRREPGANRAFPLSAFPGMLPDRALVQYFEPEGGWFQHSRCIVEMDDQAAGGGFDPSWYDVEFRQLYEWVKAAILDKDGNWPVGWTEDGIEPIPGGKRAMMGQKDETWLMVKYNRTGGGDYDLTLTFASKKPLLAL